MAALFLLLASTAGCGALAGGCERTEVTTDTGLRYRDLRCGTGDVAASGDEVSVLYEARIQNGGVVLAPDAGEPYTFVVGAGQVIAGWDEGVEGMSEGGIRKLIVPPELALGEQSIAGRVPPNATVVFEIELVDVEPTRHSD